MNLVVAAEAVHIFSDLFGRQVHDAIIARSLNLPKISTK